MTSMVNAAVTAMVSSLQTAPAVATQIARVRLRPLAQSVTKAVVVRPLQANVVEHALSPGYPVGWTTAIAVECYARSGAATAADVAVDTLLEAVYARLLTDPTLGGAVLSLQPQDITYDFDADGEQTTCATLVFHARHRSQGSTLS